MSAIAKENGNEEDQFGGMACWDRRRAQGFMVLTARRRSGILLDEALRSTFSLDLSDKLPSLAPKAQEPDVPGELFYGKAPPISSRLCAPWECQA